MDLKNNIRPKKDLGGVANLSYEGTLHYYPSLANNKDKNGKIENKIEQIDKIDKNESKKKPESKGSMIRRRGNRPINSPVASNVSSLLEKIKIDTKKKTENHIRDSTSPTSISDSCTTRSPSADRSHSSRAFSPSRLAVVPWPQTYVKPPKKMLPPINHLQQQQVKFSSKGLLSQTFHFTPLMYRRAVSLRGHSTRKHHGLIAAVGGDSIILSEVSTSLRRSSSEKGSRNRYNLVRKSPRGTTISRSLSVCSTSTRTSCMNRLCTLHHDEHSTMNGLQRSSAQSRDDVDLKMIEDSTSITSCGSCESFDMAEFVKTNANCDREFAYPNSEALANDLNFFLKDLDKYLNGLKLTLDMYEDMKINSPDKIRLHFDLPLQEIDVMHKFQSDINKCLEQADGDLLTIAKVFLDNRFSVYKDYMIMCPNILKDMQTYKDHLDSNYSTFKEKMLKPSNRLNFYVQILNNLQRYASFAERNELRRAINHLETLKRDANTEMTVKIIQECPIDLHLGGNILHVGELTYVSGPLPKRPYYLIAFENMLVVTISKVSYFLYVAHYRTDQLVSVGGEKELGLTITATVSNQGCSEVHKFRTSSNKVLETWYYLIEEWLYESTASYEIIPDSTLNDLNPSEGKLFPLSLWKVFPFLKNLKLNPCKNSEGHKVANHKASSDTAEIETEKSKSIRELAMELIEKENEYLKKLNGVFNPETLPPPPELIEQLKRFLNLHELQFLPEMQLAFKKKDELVIDIFMNYLEKFSTYRNYMVKRSLCTTQFPDGLKAQHYVIPVQQFAYYINWASELGKHESFAVAADFAVDTLMAYLTDAKVMLLHEAIPNCCIDFYRTGELRRCEPLELKVRPRQKGLRDGMYIIALFEKVILITRPCPPRYNLVIDLWLNQINFGPPSESPNAFKLEFRQGRSKMPITYEFKTKNSLSKGGWIDEVAEELQKLAEQIRKYSGSKQSH